MKQSEPNQGAAPDTTKMSLTDAIIEVAEGLGDITYEWKGRHLVRKWTGEGGLAGFYRSMEVMFPAEFRAKVQRMYRHALMSENTAAIEQIFADADYSLTVHEFCAIYSKTPARPVRSKSRASAKSRIKALLDSLERDPQTPRSV